MVRSYAPHGGYRLTYDCGGDSRTESGKRKTLGMVSSVWTKLTLLALALCLALGSVSATGAHAEEHANRKIIHSQKPEYSAVLKLLGIGGTVRLSVKVLANGTVADVQILGGNPVLAESAVKAVKTWQYAAASSSSNEILKIEFNPR
jgi:TonB family protein